MSAFENLLNHKLDVALPLGIVALSVAAVLPSLMENKAITKFPLIGVEIGGFEKRRKYFIQHAKALHSEGYKKFTEAIYRITDTEGDMIVLPIKYLEELRKVPDHILNNKITLQEMFMTRYTGHDSDSEILNHIIRADLTHNLPRIQDRLLLEVAQTVPEQLGTSPDWKSIQINEVMLKIVAIVSGHIFIGSKHNRHPVYLHASINYTVDLIKTAEEIKTWNKWLRFIGKYQVPSLKPLQQHKVAATKFLAPIIEERRRAAEAGEEIEDDCLTWIMNKANKFGINTDAEIAQTQLTLTFFDLIAECPEVIPEVRKEAQRVLDENDGIMSTQALQQMKLLDSIMRESQRMNPTGVSKFWRRLVEPLTLKDGTTFPKGSTIAVPHFSVNHDPKYYPDPYRFNPYRFVDLREGKTEDPLNYANKEQYQYISVKPESVGFGYGKHSCPGRFFASAEIKMIVVRMLLDYDIKMPDGVEGRYQSKYNSNGISPDSTKCVDFRYVGNI
ncbi:ent-kaurene oxidase [Microdochium nivale]|nr:ent-kaurene oxidase [Microdochium nivale]